MTDQEIAAEITEKVNALNAVLKIAAESGIECRLRPMEYARICAASVLILTIDAQKVTVLLPK